MISLMQGLDYSALIIGILSLIVAYHKNNGEQKSSELSDVKDYYVNLVKELNIRNKHLSDKIDVLEERILTLESQHDKYLDKLLVAKCVNYHGEEDYHDELMCDGVNTRRGYTHYYMD